MTLLAIDWSSVMVQTGQFILSFSILVVLHELGHFVPARFFKCRVEKFYLFFNPYFSLFKIKRGETEYGIGWIPFGGFVKISGMVDESMDKEQMKLPPKDYEFRSKPAWQRLIIMVGGVIVNVVLAIVIFIGITAYWGDKMLPIKSMQYGIATNDLAKKVGLKDGDNIIAIDNRPVTYFGDETSDVVFKNAKTFTVKRDSQTVTIALPNDLTKQLTKDGGNADFIGVRFPAVVDSVGATAKIVAGTMQKGDQFISINGQSTVYYNEVVAIAKKLKNETITIRFLRGNDTVTTKLTLKDGKLGYYTKSPDQFFKYDTVKYTFAQSIPVGIKRCKETLTKYIIGIKKIFTGEVNANDSLGSVISIGKTFPKIWIWERFWELTAIFSIILAFMNILPIPGLDGGHALFCIVEMITGRKPSDKFMEYAQIGGMALLLSLMVYALGLDVWRNFIK
jgi:regulator of sigma E protease